MNIDVVIAQLRELAPIFAGNVAGAAAYANAAKDQVYLPMPAAYVLHLEDDAELNDSLTDLQQIVHEKIAVIVVLETLNVGGSPDPADRRAQAATAYLDTVRAAIWSSILNWRPDWNSATPTTNREARGIYYIGSGFPQEGAFDRARFFYQFIFGLDTTVTDVDGWQQPFEPLVEIEGTVVNQDDPTGPPVQFQVDFPLPAS